MTEDERQVLELEELEIEAEYADLWNAFANEDPSLIH
ncbi:hypothetical protein BH18THE2_BH18THE2_37960 [soil metagenome]